MVVVRVVVVRTKIFLSPAVRGSVPRGSGTNAKYCKVQPRVVVVRLLVVRVVVVRTQNFLCPATRGNCTRGSGARGSGTNAKFFKSSRAC